MAQLSISPGSITWRQGVAIWSTARRRGISREQVHEAAEGPLCDLSRAQASELIRVLKQMQARRHEGTKARRGDG
jgi:hypothetical protein